MRDEAVFLAASPLVTAPPSNLTRLRLFSPDYYTIPPATQAIFRALGRFGSFLNLYMYIQIETFMCTITSHKIKQRAKYQTEMLSRIAKTAILVKSSNYKLSFQRKTNPQTVDPDNQTFNCDNADGHSQTGNRKNIGK